MKLSERTVSVLLTDDGRTVMEAVGLSVPPPAMVSIEVAESEELGLWIRIDRAGKTHHVLVRWEYILTVDLPEREFPRSLIHESVRR